MPWAPWGCSCRRSSTSRSSRAAARAAVRPSEGSSGRVLRDERSTGGVPRRRGLGSCEALEHVGGLLALVGADALCFRDLLQDALLLGDVLDLIDLAEHPVGPLRLDVLEGRGLARGGVVVDRLELFVGAFEVLRGGEVLRFFEHQLVDGAHLDDGFVGGRRGRRRFPPPRQADDRADHEQAHDRADADELADARAARGRDGGADRGRDVVEAAHRAHALTVGAEAHAGAEDLASADEAQAHVAELERVARLEDAALQLDAVDADAVRAPLVDDLEAAVAERDELGVQAAHRAVVDGDRRVFGATDREVLSVERELRARVWPDDHDEAVRPLVHGHLRERALLRGCVRDRRHLRLVDELEAVVTELHDVAAVDGLLPDDADAVDEGAVVAREVANGPPLTAPLDLRMVARDVAVGQANRVTFAASEPVLVVGEGEHGLLPLVVLDR